MSFKTKLVGAAASTKLKLQKEAPTIALGAGVTGFVGTVVLAVKATGEARKVLDDHKERIQEQKQALHLANQDDSIEYSEETYRRATFGNWIITIGKLAKVYGPTILVGSLSIASLIAGHRIQTRRLMGVTAAYETVRTAFDRYREVVTEEIGEEKEKEVFEKAATPVVDEETGVTHQFAGPTTKWFDESTTENYRDSRFENMRFLEDVQIAMNERLQRKGHLFLNDVFEALGMEETPLGCQLGWIHHRGSRRESYVDFGLGMNPSAETDGHVREMVAPHALLLDFNVDGVIWNQI